MENKTLETIAKTADSISVAGWGYLTIEFALATDSLRGIGAPVITGFITYMKGKDIFAKEKSKYCTQNSKIKIAGLTIAGILMGIIGTAGAVTGNSNIARPAYALCAATLSDALAHYARSGYARSD